VWRRRPWRHPDSSFVYQKIASIGIKARKGTSMKFKIRTNMGRVAIAGAMLLSADANAQRDSPVESRPAAYDMKRESVLQGTVLNYTEKSLLPPIGAHVTIQTATGIVDVHLGPASYLGANNFALSAGESVRFVGVSTRANKGNIFLARIAQKHDQSIAIRSPRGLPQAAAARVLRQAVRSQTTVQVGPR
jgi:hypothetical protein